MAARAVWIVTKERPSDRVGIFDVQCLALGEAEAQLVDQLREEEGSNYGPSVVAEEAGRIIGHTLLTRTRFVSDAGEAKEIYVLGPMGVVPERQRCGLGKEMIRLALDLIKLPVAVLGHDTYYPRSGFEPALDRGLRSVFSDAGPHWMVWFPPGADSKDWIGEVVYPKAFQELL